MRSEIISQPREVATFRKDGPYEDGRHPSHVEFVDEIEDAKRRDFTINALFFDPETDKANVDAGTAIMLKAVKTDATSGTGHAIVVVEYVERHT